MQNSDGTRQTRSLFSRSGQSDSSLTAVLVLSIDAAVGMKTQYQHSRFLVSPGICTLPMRSDCPLLLAIGDHKRDARIQATSRIHPTF